MVPVSKVEAGIIVCRSMEEMFSRLPKSTLVLIAFGSVYLMWGSTYLAIHVAGEHLPVPVVSGTRSLISRH